MLFYHNDKENKARILPEEGFKDSLSLNTVIRCPVGKTKLSMELAWRGDISIPQRHTGQRWDWDRGEKDGEAKFQRCFAEHKLRLVRFWCTKCSLPRTLTHTCVCVGHSTQPQKKHTHGLQAPHPLPFSLSALSTLLHDQSLFTFVG